MMKKRLVHRAMSVVFTVLIGLAIHCASSAAEQALDRIVAVVNETAITASQLDHRIAEIKRQYQQAGRTLTVNHALREQVLNQLIDVELEKQKAASIGLVVGPENLDKAIADIAQKNKLTLPQLKQKLTAQGMSWENYRQEIHNQILANELQRQSLGQANIVVSDAEIDELLRDPAFKIALSDYHLLGVLVPVPANATAAQKATVKQQAEKLAQQLQTHSDWQKVLNEAFAQGTLLQASDLGWRKAGEFPPFIAEALPHLTVGQVAGPLAAPNGFHLLKVLAVRDSVQPGVVKQYRASHILLKTNVVQSDEQIKQRLLAIRQQIVQGQDFATVAEKYSQDPISAGKGGALGWVVPEMLDPRFAQAMEQLKPGEVSMPVKSAYGWHIIQVSERKQEALDAQTVKRNQAKQVLYKKKADEAVKNWLQELRKDAYIKINL